MVDANESGVRVSGEENFERWNWDNASFDFDEYAIKCAKLVMQEIAKECCFGITDDDEGGPEDVSIDFSIFEGNVSFSIPLLKLIELELFLYLGLDGMCEAADVEHLIGALEIALARLRSKIRAAPG